MRPQRCTKGLGDRRNGPGKVTEQRGFFLSVSAEAKFSVFGSFVLHVGQEDRDAGMRGKQIVSLSSRDGGRQKG